MKRILYFLISIMLMSPSSFAQNKKAPARTTTAKPAAKAKAKSTAKAKTTAKKPAASSTAKASAPKTRLFEGTLMYASQEYHSKAVKKYSYGQAYTGRRQQSITVSGNKLHIIDENLYVHTIMDSDANVCYIYSDLTNSGVSFPLNAYRELFSQLSAGSKFNSVKWSTTGRTQYKGDALNTYHGTISSKTPESNTRGSIEMWSSAAFGVGDIMRSAFYGADPHGLVRRWVWETKTDVPFVGTLHTIVSAELIAMKEYHVSPDVFTIPSDIAITPDDIKTCKNLVKFYKAHQKAMKKQGLNLDENAEDVLPEITSKWPFVQAIESSESYAGSIGCQVWGEISSGIITAAASLTREELEKRRIERMEEEMQRMTQEQQEAETMEALQSQQESAYASRPTHTSRGQKSKTARPSAYAQSRVAAPAGMRTSGASSQAIYLEGQRAKALRERRGGGHGLTSMVLNQKSIEEKYIREHMSKAYVTPGTEFDRQKHYLCTECKNYSGVCPFCNGMGFQRKVYTTGKIVNGHLQYAPSDVPMKSKRKDCGICSGSGVCHICKGSGKGVQEIGSTGIRKSCISCHGTKKCKTCSGKGAYTIHIPDPTGECGFVDESTQSSRKTVTGTTDCGQCGGSGKCHQCHGEKTYYYAGKPVTCEQCTYGECHVCKGTRISSYTKRE